MRAGINDGACALILMRKDDALARGIEYLAEIHGYARAVLTLILWDTPLNM